MGKKTQYGLTPFFSQHSPTPGDGQEGDGRDDRRPTYTIDREAAEEPESEEVFVQVLSDVSKVGLPTTSYN